MRHIHPILEELQQSVFLAFIKPFKAVSSSTVASWLKSLLEAAGIDTSVFNAH